MAPMQFKKAYISGKTIGSGGFGSVLSCKHRATGEEHAVKMLLRSKTSLNEAKREAQILQDLDHPNIVKCHGFFLNGSIACIAMEKFAGGALVDAMEACWE